MKKIIFVSLTMGAFLIILTGCSPKTNLAGSSESKTKAAAGTPRNDNLRRPDFGQPDRQADVRGVIKTIIGNEVSILKIDIGSRGIGQETASSTGATANSDGPGSENIAVSLSLGGTVGIPGGGGMRGGAGGASGGPGGFVGGGPGGTPDGQNSSTARAQMLEQLKALSTGEEKIIIPVGIKMLKSSTSAASTGKPEMIEATLSDLTADKMITIWLNTAVTDKKVAEFVLLN